MKLGGRCVRVVRLNRGKRWRADIIEIQHIPDFKIYTFLSMILDILRILLTAQKIFIFRDNHVSKFINENVYQVTN